MGKGISGQEKLDHCIEHMDCIENAQSAEFIEGLNDQLKGWEDLTEKQRNWVEDIYEVIS